MEQITRCMEEIPYAFFSMKKKKEDSANGKKNKICKLCGRNETSS